MEEWVGLHISIPKARLGIQQVLSGRSKMGPKAPLKKKKTNRWKKRNNRELWFGSQLQVI